MKTVSRSTALASAILAANVTLFACGEDSSEETQEWRFAEEAHASDDNTIELEPSLSSDDIDERVSLDDGTEVSFFDEGDDIGVLIVGSSPESAEWIDELRSSEATPLEIYLSIIEYAEHSPPEELLDGLERHHENQSHSAPRSFGAPRAPMATGTTTGDFNICASNPQGGVGAWINFYVSTLSVAMDTYYHESLETGNGIYTLPTAQFKDLGACVVSGTITWRVQLFTGSSWSTIAASVRTVDAGDYVFYENTSGSCGQRRARITDASGDTYNVSGSVRGTVCSI